MWPCCVEQGILSARMPLSRRHSCRTLLRDFKISHAQPSITKVALVNQSACLVTRSAKRRNVSRRRKWDVPRPGRRKRGERERKTFNRRADRISLGKGGELVNTVARVGATRPTSFWTKDQCQSQGSMPKSPLVCLIRVNEELGCFGPPYQSKVSLRRVHTPPQVAQRTGEAHDSDRMHQARTLQL